MRFKELGPSVQIHEPVTFVSPDQIAFKGHAMISEYVHIIGGQGTTIGQYVHIASHVGIGGGGYFLAEDFVNIAAGSKLITGTDAVDGTGLIGPAVPPKFRNVTRSFIHLKTFSFVATNVTILPGVTFGEGAVAAAGAVVTKDLQPWTIYAGNPAKPVKDRKRHILLALSQKLHKQAGTKPFVIEKLPWYTED